ncbi:hypothetical protein EYF80_015491 [Liparis tanakae]|uniref:Uncharacterized protein n=1 Tax=Liparis tanakae TaxID=230148 RepID=A0A4Z2I8G1_9TELE|nr:hypothetical protein EYF80_015491 [Liparis tanakae]
MTGPRTAPHRPPSNLWRRRDDNRWMVGGGGGSLSVLFDGQTEKGGDELGMSFQLQGFCSDPAH